MLVNSLGSTGYEFSDGLISQLLNVGTKGQDCDGKGPNFMLSIIRGVNPQDEVESMLAAQMAAVHMATMTVVRRLNHVDNFPQQDSASNAFNKLARTFAVQLEALKRYRTGGEQRVTVQHVTVNEGGQAIVGAVTPPTGGAGHAEKSQGQPRGSSSRLAHDAAAGAGSASLWRTQPEGQPMSRARHGERTMPDARGQEHRTEDGRGTGKDAAGQDEARIVFCRNTTTDACGSCIATRCAASVGRDAAAQPWAVRMQK
jgi:hypothetical protein